MCFIESDHTSEVSTMKRCANKLCNDELKPLSHELFCPSCRFIGRWGMFFGGVIVGAIVGILKLAKVM